jgi:hypothetical protein
MRRFYPQNCPHPTGSRPTRQKNMDQFLLPVRFSHHDSSQMKLNVDTSDKNEPKLNLKGVASTPSKVNPKQQKSVCRIFGKVRQQNSIFVNFKDKEIPTRPLESAVKLSKHRNLEERIERVRQVRWMMKHTGVYRARAPVCRVKNQFIVAKN